VRVQIDSEKCQGHGRCYDLAPDVFTDDEDGNGQVIGDGTITGPNEENARLAVANCPESAISLIEEN
jgi:ferredoxin